MTSSAQSNQHNLTLGILMMIAFAIVAPMMDALAKGTPHEIPVSEALLARFGIQALLMLPIALALGILHRPGAREAGLHLLRGGFLLLATWFFFSALRHMPIANAISIFFVEPFIVTLLGAVFLGEVVRARRLTAAAVGFGGAMLVIQPSFKDLGLVALFPLGTAVCFALYMILTRSMAQKVHPIAMQGYTALAAVVLVAPLLVWFDGTGNEMFDPVWPSQRAMWFLLGVGVIASISHLFLSIALKLAPAGVIAPLQYLEIVTGVVLGYFFFDDFPNALTWLGIFIIVGSGLYIFSRERKLEEVAETPPTPAP